MSKIWLMLLGLLFLIVFYITLDANKYRAEARVIEGDGKVGVNPTTELLDFGDLSHGTTGVRRVDIQNGTGIPMGIGIIELGNISSLMNISENYFVLKPNSSEKLEFTIYMPASGEIGKKYTGRVFVFRIPMPGAN